MNCNSCNYPNNDNANFCCRCGAELYNDTLVSESIGNTATAFSIPTAGVRAFSGVNGNYALQTAAMAVRNSVKEHETLREYTTNVKVQPMENGDWFCPDCGELNNHNDRSCRGCGKYK